MSQALDDLKTAVAGLATDTDAELAAIETKLAAIAANSDDADLQNLTAQIGATRAKLQAETAALTAPPVDAGTPTS